MTKKITALFLTLLVVLCTACMLAVSSSAAGSIAKASVSYQNTYTYTGKEIKPKVTVKLSGKTLGSKYYSVTYSNNKMPGKAKITIKGKNGYSGSVAKYFYIKPKAVTSLKSSSVTSSSVKLTWAKVTGASSYQVYIYSSSKGEWVKKATVKTNSATVSGLTAATSYKFKVRACKDGDKALYGSYSSNITVNTKPAKVTSVSVKTTETSGTISWKKVAKAKGYQVYLYSSSKEEWVKKATVSTNSYKLTGLTGATSYKIKIRAYTTVSDKNIYGDYSSNVSFCTKPAKVTSVSVKSEETSGTISWKKVSKAKGYEVYLYSASKEEWIKKATVSTNSYKLTGLTGATSYKIKVRAYTTASDKKIYGDYSSNVSFYTKPAKVTSVSVKAAETSGAISWKKVSKATGYQVYLYSSSTNEWVKKATVSTNSYTLTGLSKLKDYKIKVRAYVKTSSSTVCGAYSDVKGFSTTPSAVKNVKVSCSSSSKATVSWDKISGVKGYVVYVNEYTADGKATSYVKYKSTIGNSITVSGLTGNRIHRFKVEAYYTSSANGTIYGVATTSSTCRTYPSANENFYWYDCTNSSIALAWNEDSYVSGYQLYVLSSDGKKQLLKDMSSKETNYTHTGLEELAPYTYYLRAYYKASNATYYGDFAMVTAKTDDSCVKGVSFTKKKTSLNVDASYTIKAEVIPSYAVNKGVKYTSSNTKVATISSSGKITAKSVGTTKITATSVEGSYTASYTLTVNPLVSTALDMPDTITLFVGYPCKIEPNFIPENTTNKAFTVSKKSDYTYTYKGLISTKTETLLFSDYISIDSKGNFTGKKATIEPKGNKNVFAFDVTFKASDSGVTKTVKIMVAETIPTITLTDSTPSEWYCSNTSTLDVSLNSTVYFGERDLLWESSDESVAKVDENGNITCVGSGKVKITCYAPYKVTKAECTIDVKEYCTFEKTYYENCKPGDVYNLVATVYPKSSKTKICYISTDRSMLTVDEKGTVTFLGEDSTKDRAKVIAYLETQPNVQIQINFTSKKCDIPSGSKIELFKLIKKEANKIKSSADLVGFERSEYATIDSLKVTNLKQSGVFASLMDFENSFLLPVLESNSKKRTSYVSSVSIEDENYNQAWKEYMTKIPVSGQVSTILDSLNISAVKEIKVINDANSYVYGFKMTLSPESFSSLPTDTTNTAHGSVFDILSKSHINNITNASAAGMTLKFGYNSFKTSYHDSSFTVYINKITGKVDSFEYDMTLDVDVKALDVKLAYALVNLEYNSDVTFTCNNVIKINFWQTEETQQYA